MADLPPSVAAFWTFLVLNAALLTVYRSAFWGWFRHRSPDAPAAEIRRALWLGFRLDLRLVVVLCLPPLVLSLIPGLRVVPGEAGPMIWWIWFSVVWAAVTALYLLDGEHFGYLSTRLNATVSEHLDAPGVALRTSWESFPILRHVLVFAVVSAAYSLCARALLFDVLADRSGQGGLVVALAAWTATVLVIVAGLHGRAGKFPLRWSDAFAIPTPFATSLALNPVLFLFDTWDNRKFKSQPEHVRPHYEDVCQQLGVTDVDLERLTFTRRVEPRTQLARRPNVVVVVLESFAGYKVGVGGNQLDSTPYFDAIARRSVLFDNFFAVTSPTARAMFTLLTGIPDVNPVHSASRNPLLVRQRMLFNAFEDYRKMFFIGGSASWGNIRGVLSHNVPDLRIYEEGHFKAPRNDGWGISDRQLFIEASEVFREQEGPFAALMLASGNHRPWTIPKDRGDFELRTVDEKTLRANGFDSLDEFNSFRFLDHSIGELIRLADSEPYGRDTLFFFLGDHGAGAPHETPWERLGLTHVHTPMAIYGPGLLEPRNVSTVMSSLDIFPTALGLAGLPYENSTLGVDVFGDSAPNGPVAFVRRPPHFGLVGQEHFLKLGPADAAALYRYRSDDPCEDVAQQMPDETERMRRLCMGYLRCARFMLHH